MLHTNPDEYMNGLLEEIESNKRKGKKALYRISAEITDVIASIIKTRFSNNPSYILEMKKCATCTNTWDIIIIFR